MAGESNTGSVMADAVIGALAGAAAVWVMDRVDWFNFRHEDPEARMRTQAVRPGGMAPAQVAAKRGSEALGYDLDPTDRKVLGKSAHYALGILPGTLYGALRHKVPALGAGRGTVFGTSLFLMQDEGINAITGLSAKPGEYPWQAHARGFVAHAVYGLVLDTVLDLADSLRGKHARA